MNQKVFPARDTGALVFFVAMVLVLSSLMPRQALAALPDFSGLVEKYGDAVVNISSEKKNSLQQSLRGQLQGQPFDPSQLPDLFRHFFEQYDMPTPNTQSLGSGLIISEDGYILTNHHVVNNADEVIVRLADRRELVAEIIGSDEPTDIALIKVEDKGLPVVQMGRSDKLKVGQWVFAIGSPYGFDHSVTAGIVSAKGRSLPNDSYVPFIQTDVAINPGNSGGPLFNMAGEVVGINSQIYSRTGGFMGLSFAIPINIALEVAEQLKTAGHVKRGWLGVMIQEVNRDLAESFGLKRPHGALVADVVKDSPAKKAGLRAGDIIVEFNGAVLNLASDLPPMVGRVAPGKQAEMVLIREKKRKTIKVKVGELPADELAANVRGSDSRMDGNGKLGMTVKELDSELKAQSEVESGVAVTSVSKGPALEADIRPGDIVTMLNYEVVTSVRQFRKIVAQLPAGKSIPMQIHRRGKPLFVPIRLK